MAIRERSLLALMMISFFIGVGWASGRSRYRRAECAARQEGAPEVGGRSESRARASAGPYGRARHDDGRAGPDGRVRGPSGERAKERQDEGHVDARSVWRRARKPPARTGGPPGTVRGAAPRRAACQPAASQQAKGTPRLALLYRAGRRYAVRPAPVRSPIPAAGARWGRGEPKGHWRPILNPSRTPARLRFSAATGANPDGAWG